MCVCVYVYCIYINRHTCIHTVYAVWANNGCLWFCMYVNYCVFHQMFIGRITDHVNIVFLFYCVNILGRRHYTACWWNIFFSLSLVFTLIFTLIKPPNSTHWPAPWSWIRRGFSCLYSWVCLWGHHLRTTEHSVNQTRRVNCSSFRYV